MNADMEFWRTEESWDRQGSPAGSCFRKQGDTFPRFFSWPFISRIYQAHVEVGGDAVDGLPGVPMYQDFLLDC